MPDQARLYFSLALLYLEHQNGHAWEALACLRTAHSLGFEGVERIRLYTAAIHAMSGNVHEARSLLADLQAEPLTAQETALLQRIQTGTMPLPGVVATIDGDGADSWELAHRTLLTGYPDVQNLLVVGDPSARTATWVPSARYLLVDTAVTGLTLSGIASLNVRFDVCICPSQVLADVRDEGIHYQSWVPSNPTPPAQRSA
jgi:hypothetical protein